MGHTALTVRVTGRVQGVWFRAWTRQQARALGLAGWVRNDPDGSVRALIVGPEAKVQQMLAALHEGPQPARVDRVETAPASPADAPRGFTIAR